MGKYGDIISEFADQSNYGSSTSDPGYVFPGTTGGKCRFLGFCSGRADDNGRIGYRFFDSSTTDDSKPILYRCNLGDLGNANACEFLSIFPSGVSIIFNSGIFFKWDGSSGFREPQSVTIFYQR